MRAGRLVQPERALRQGDRLLSGEGIYLTVYLASRTVVSCSNFGLAVVVTIVKRRNRVTTDNVFSVRCLVEAKRPFALE